MTEVYMSTLVRELAEIQTELEAHKLYPMLDSVEAIQTFMSYHVFAVWDFMSVVKSLQKSLTCQTIPWTPVAHPSLARLINDIVLTEECDENMSGAAQSHFGMYVDAMKDMGVEVDTISNFVDHVKTGKRVDWVLEKMDMEKGICDFVNTTFDIIHTNKVHMIASAFAFSRETMIPRMFLQILKQPGAEDPRYSKFIYYLERHVEVDGDEHGPAALNMVKTLCGTDPRKWAEAKDAAVTALEARKKYWNTVIRALKTIA